VGGHAGLSFGGLLRQLRDEAGLTQDELAEAARVSQRAVSDLERGINATARKDTAGLLAGALGLDGQVRELFVAAARGRVPAAEVLAVVQAGAGGPAARGMPRRDGAALAGPPGEPGQLVSAGTVTFVFTDIEGSTVLLRRVGEGVYAQLLADHHALVRSVLAAHGGRELNTLGDGFFAAFASPRACVAAVIQMQQVLEGHAWPAGERVRVRMGVHTGEASDTATGPVGLDVHRAARVAAVAHGGQVLVSETAAALVRDTLPPGAALVDLGTHQLKDLGRPEQIFQLSAPGLAARFPPLLSLGNPALLNNLPAQLATFIGRGRELSDVRALVESCRLVTLTGAGGAGKTRLGLQVAAGLLDGSGDGVWLAELATVTDPDAVAAAIAGALRIPGQPGRPALDALADALGPQDILIVLDNCEHLIGACAKTAETILRRCPRVHLLVTSREPLGIGGETIYRVPSLSLPGPGESGEVAAASCDAVALFAARARAQGVRLALDTDTVALAVSVCRRLDAMPLAIELAAARLRSMSLADLDVRLDQRFRLLTGGSRTAVERQQTLRAAVDWSYSLLTNPEQVLLGRLSVFAGFDLGAAEAVGGSGAIQALEVAGLLGSLVDKSLVVAEPGGAALRYRLLETIRLFAAEKLAETGAEQAAAVGAAHSAHYLAVAEAAAPHLAGPQQGSWLGRLDADQANLRRAAEHAAGEPDETAHVLRFGVALWRYWEPRSREGEAAGLLVPVLRRPEAGADPALFAEALVVAALVTMFTDMPTSLQLAEKAGEVASGLGDDRLLILSRTMLCFAYYFAGQPERARPQGAEAVQRARQLGDDVLLGMSLLAYATALDVATSGPLFAEAFACTERSGDLRVEQILHNNAGWAALERGDIPSARAHAEAAIRAAEALGTPHPAESLNLAIILRAERDLDSARSTFQEALRTGRRIGDKRRMTLAILGLACLDGDLGDWHRAAVLHGAAQTLSDQTGVPWDTFDTRYREESLDQAAAALGDEQLERAYARGMALSFDRAISLALDEILPGT
jgi:predicted ATPase/class 3 adenylate cyclase/DNA-binding XRE family transcriptional regulator